MQPPGPDPPRDRGVVKPELVELRASHNTVLTCREVRQLLVWGR
jgi:hypothetical protein